MHLVFGLGNPGSRYAHTRHNIGFLVLDRLASAYSFKLLREKFHSLWNETRWDGKRVLLIKPQTYMNRCGLSAQQWVAFFKIGVENTLIVHDDLDQELGNLKFSHGGGSGGHKGVDSIIREMSTNQAPRLKIGIGRPLHGEPIEDFVLKTFYSDQSETVEEIISRAAMAVETWVREGLSKAMNIYN